MPFNQPQRTDSWPPTVVRLSAADGTKGEETDLSTLELHSVNDNATQDERDDVEENPFSYFLSSPEDSDEEDLSAGIETPDSQSVVPIVRTVSPSDFQSRNTEETLSPVSSEEDYIYDAELFDSDDFDIGVAIPLTLREFSNSLNQSESRPRPGRTQSLSQIATAESRRPIKSHARGRSLSPHIPTSSRRLRADTYPVRRPRSWRRPSEDVWTIPEESSSASSSSKESLDSKRPEEKQAEPKSQSSSPKLTLTVPSTPHIPAFAFQEEFEDSLSPPLRLTGTLEGEDPSQISVWERDASKGQKLYSALGSPDSSQSTEEDSRLAARVTVLEETPFPQQPVVRLPLRRRKTVRFDLPDLSD